MMNISDTFLLVRGGGDLATGAIHRLASAGFRVLILETAAPSAIRRTVSFCEAVWEGSATVEGLTAVLVPSLDSAKAAWEQGRIPVLIDPDCNVLSQARPAVLVDAILAKKNLGTHRDMAPRTIALGPGFTAGVDVDVVIETSRGHDLGRVITAGAARPDTGIPGIIGGYGKERVLHCPAAGIFRSLRSIGDFVQAGEAVAYVETPAGNVPLHAAISGILRGILRHGYPVTQGFKAADIDPRADQLQNCFSISDKSRCIAGSVLEQVCAAVLR